METVANQTAQVECVVAVATHWVPAVRMPATASPWRTPRSGAAQTSPDHPRLVRSPLRIREGKTLSQRATDQHATPIQPWLDSINFLTQTRPARATRRLTSRGVGLRLPLPFNAADEVSCRAGATKCSRCRASFAPIRSTTTERNLVPPLDRQLVAPLSETKNWSNPQTIGGRRQLAAGRARYYAVELSQMRD